MMKLKVIISLIITVVMLMRSYVLAVDPPHSSDNLNPVYCNSCHSVHKATGSSLTKGDSNANLCQSCHQTSQKPLNTADQATPGLSGTSHRWDRSIAAGVAPLNLAVGNPNNAYGLRTAGEIVNPALAARLTTFGNVITCSVCHNQHNQSVTPWNPFAGPYINLKGGDSGAASSAGTNATINDSAKSTFWTANAWVGYYVKMTTGTAANIGQVRQISGNTTTQLTVSANFPAATALNDRYEIIGRQFQAIGNDLNQMCEDCHYYRVSDHTRVEGGDISYPANGTNVFSHPVSQALNANAKGYDRTAPLDVNGSLQSGTRFITGAETPDNVSNNLIVEGTTNKIRCLTCHKVHYSDSNSLSVQGLP